MSVGWHRGGLLAAEPSWRAEQPTPPYPSLPRGASQDHSSSRLPPNTAATTQLTFSRTETSEVFPPAFSCLSYHLWYQIGGRMAMSMRCSCPAKRRNLLARKCCACFPESLSPECVCFDVFAQGEPEAEAEGFHFSQRCAVKPSS